MYVKISEVIKIARYNTFARLKQEDCEINDGGGSAIIANMERLANASGKTS